MVCLLVKQGIKGLGIVMTQTNLEQFAMASGALQSSVDNSKAAKMPWQEKNSRSFK